MTEGIEVVTPADRAELAVLVRACDAAGRAFAFVGGGTQLGLGNPPRDLATVIRTTALAGVLDYAPEDQTITVEAGMTFAALDAVLAEHGQMLPIDVVDRDKATIGGAIATNAFGARRHRYGSLKDLIVGIEIVRPDGTPAHGGGKVVKNVAGFDLPKLFVGSLGTLGAIAAATLRVFPRPAAAGAVLVRELRAGGAGTLAAAILAAQLEPSEIVAVVAGDALVTAVLFEGHAAAVTAQMDRLLAIAAQLGAVGEIANVADLMTVNAHELAARTHGAWRVCIETAPTRLGDVALPGPVGAAIEYPSLGVAFASGGDDGRDLDALAGDWRAARERCGGTIVFHGMPERWRGRIDAWGDPPASFELMRALKAQFDPKGLCNPGRFVGGL